MRKIWILGIALTLLLSGCGEGKTYETMGKPSSEGTPPEPRQIVVQLPQEAAAAASETETRETVYLCDGYTLSLQTMAGGDLQRTVKAVTGHEKEDLELISTERNGARRYICVWTSAGEPELQVGRTCILDDGTYHYVVTAMANESQSGKLAGEWQEVFESFRLVDASAELNTGS